MNYCRDCQHQQHHSVNMIWCKEVGHVKPIDKPIDCNSFHEKGVTDKPEPSQIPAAVGRVSFSATVDIFGAAV